MMITQLATTLLSGMLLLHPVHETVSEVEWNPATDCLEVALRLDQLDEQWIARQCDTEQPAWQAEYLRKQVFFDPPEKADGKGVPQGKPIRWVGRKEQGGYVWWFYEVICKDGKPPQHVRTQLLFQHERGYQHRIILLDCVESNRQDSAETESASLPRGAKKNCSVILNEKQPQVALPLRQFESQR